MPMWKYENFEVCVLDQKSKWHSEEEANKICWEIKKRVEDSELSEFITEILLAEQVDFENKEFEILTTAKQTDSRYWDFSFSKEQLEEMANNFNDDVVWTEIPVDLNHDPEHIAYAWIKPGSMTVKESSKLKWQYSLYCKLYKFTDEWKEIIKQGKIRYFSLQIQNKFEKFIEKTKKLYNNVIRALALTNMPVIKDMSPILSENTKTTKDILFINPSIMDIKELELKLSEKDNLLNEKELALSNVMKELSEKEELLKTLSEEKNKLEKETREKKLSEMVESLCLSENKNIWFKGWEKEKVLEFVKSLSEEQAEKYFEIHNNIISWVNLGEEWKVWEEKEVNELDVLDNRAKELSEKKKISYWEALKIALSESK